MDFLRLVPRQIDGTQQVSAFSPENSDQEASKIPRPRRGKRLVKRSGPRRKLCNGNAQMEIGCAFDTMRNGVQLTRFPRRERDGAWIIKHIPASSATIQPDICMADDLKPTTQSKKVIAHMVRMTTDEHPPQAEVAAVEDDDESIYSQPGIVSSVAEVPRNPVTVVDQDGLWEDTCIGVKENHSVNNRTEIRGPSRNVAWSMRNQQMKVQAQKNGSCSDRNRSGSRRDQEVLDFSYQGNIGWSEKEVTPTPEHNDKEVAGDVRSSSEMKRGRLVERASELRNSRMAINRAYTTRTNSWSVEEGLVYAGGPTGTGFRAPHGDEVGIEDIRSASNTEDLMTDFCQCLEDVRATIASARSSSLENRSRTSFKTSPGSVNLLPDPTTLEHCSNRPVSQFSSTDHSFDSSPDEYNIYHKEIDELYEDCFHSESVLPRQESRQMATAKTSRECSRPGDVWYVDSSSVSGHIGTQTRRDDSCYYSLERTPPPSPPRRKREAREPWAEDQQMASISSPPEPPATASDNREGTVKAIVNAQAAPSLHLSEHPPGRIPKIKSLLSPFATIRLQPSPPSHVPPIHPEMPSLHFDADIPAPLRPRKRPAMSPRRHIPIPGPAVHLANAAFMTIHDAHTVPATPSCRRQFPSRIPRLVIGQRLPQNEARYASRGNGQAMTLCSRCLVQTLEGA